MTDVIVVGGGHNGLVCAAYLGRAGYRVQVLEATDTLGGCAGSREFAPGYRCSALASFLYALHPQVIADLKLAEAGLERGPAVDTVALDAHGAHLHITADRVSGEALSGEDGAAYAAFKREFRAYAAALEPLATNTPPRLKDMDRKDLFTLAKLGWKLRFGLGAESMREFLRVGGINIYDVLNEVFDDQRLKGALAADAVLGHHMGPRTPTTVLTWLHRLAGENYGPTSLPPGGMGKVIETLATAARGQGAEIRTGSPVERIDVYDGGVRGVLLEDGERLEAALVVSSADAKTTFLDLVGARELDAMFAHRISKTRGQGDVARLHLGLNGLPEIPGLEPADLAQRLLIAPDMRYVEHAFNHAKYGEFSHNPVLEVSLPSLSDGSLAPPGRHVMSVSASFAPRVLKGGWPAQRDAFTERVLQTLQCYAPGLSSLVNAQKLITPEDIERDYRLRGGHWHHGQLTIDQSLMMRPVHGTAQYSTPVNGLYLCGAAAHPGGGVSGLPGRNAALRIISSGASA